MIAQIKHNDTLYNVNLNLPIDLSIPIHQNGPCAWGVSKLKIEAAKQDGWVGDIQLGGAVNFNNIFFNPHAHTTHTECVGHISPNKDSLNSELKQFFFPSELITVSPEKIQNDYVITKPMLEECFHNKEDVSSLIIRTLPNNKNKKRRNYSNTNPPYFLKEAIDYIVALKIEHLLIDLPSVDKEKDDGQLISHSSFWQFPNNIRRGCTITEMIYVPEKVVDGIYLLNLQFPPFENDASPSRPLLFKLNKKIAK